MKGRESRLNSVTLALERQLSGDRPEMRSLRTVVMMMRARKAKVAKSKVSTRQI